MDLPDAFFETVLNRGRPPASFLEKLIAWAKETPDEIFSEAYRGTEPDIYDTLLKHRLDLAGGDRKALMCEVLRVLGGFESSWDWTEGRDVTNPTSGTPATEEAGIFQCSANSVNFDPSLAACFNRWARETGRADWQDMSRSGRAFIGMSKDTPFYALEHTARLLRFTIRHHGPVVRAEIFPWLRATAVSEFRRVLGDSDPTDGLKETILGATMASSELVDLLDDASSIA
jgi:hypothetical protein